MKKILIALNVVLLLLVGFLYFKVFSNKQPVAGSTKSVARDSADSTAGAKPEFRVAYLDLDSLQAHYGYFQTLKAEFEKKQKAAANEITSLQKKFQTRTEELQQKAATMTPAEQEKAMAEINKMQQDFQTRQQTLDNDLMNYNAKTQKEILEKIESFLTDYNKDGRFSYILSFEPGFMLYKDSTLDITQDVLRGLNKVDPSAKGKTR